MVVGLRRSEGGSRADVLFLMSRGFSKQNLRYPT